VREILSDLVAEQQFLDQSLQRIPIKNWDRVTPSKPWTVRDTISHLADFAELAADTLAGGSKVQEWRTAGDLDALRQKAIKRGRSMRPQDVIEWWRAGRARVVEPLSHMSEEDRVEWIEGSMSAKTFATFRLMETWAHGLDIYHALDIEVEDTARIRHVCWLGWKTLPYAFKAAGIDYSPIRVEVIGPGYAKWTYGPAEAEDLIKGPASEWARIVVRRLPPGKARLKTTGELAEKALEVAQAYL
jgi:uncharacterized protein (TIGR03084 family)